MCAETSLSQTARPLRVLIAASGSGGHLFPALHIARAIVAESSGAVIEFVGSGRPLEAKLIDPHGFKRHVVPITGIKQRGIKGVLDFALAVPRAVWRLGRVLRELRPDVVVGVGGYVSVLPVLLGRLRGIPTWIHEAELKPGLANGFLSLFADKISVAFADAAIKRRSAVVYTGHPVRAGLAEVRRMTPREKLSRLLVLGGSQGATAIDRVVGEIAPVLAARGIEVWHQCRPENVLAVQRAYTEAGVVARVDSFIDDVSAAFAWSDVVVSRSGASALMETSVVNIPAIFVPYPFAQGNHQRANAEVLVRAGKALLVEEGDSFADRLGRALGDIFTPERYAAILGAPYEARSVDAAKRIAAGVSALAGRSATGEGASPNGPIGARRGTGSA